MHRDEFIEAARRYNRRGTIIFAIPLVVGLLLSFSYKPFEERFGGFLAARINGPVPQIVRLLPFGVPLVIAAGVIIRLTRKNDREMGVACPHCGQPLAQSKAIVVASKNCPYCGLKVIDDTI